MKSTITLYTFQFPCQTLWVFTHMECPSPLLFWFSESFPIPVIDCGNPSFCSFTFQRLLLSLISLRLQKHVDTVLEPDNKIGFVTMRNLLMLIWNTQTEMIVTDIALDELRMPPSKSTRNVPISVVSSTTRFTWLRCVP